MEKNDISIVCNLLLSLLIYNYSLFPDFIEDYNPIINDKCDSPVSITKEDPDIYIFINYHINLPINKYYIIDNSKFNYIRIL